MKKLREFLSEGKAHFDRLHASHFRRLEKNPHVYHTSSAENHESIKKHGLRSTEEVAKNGKKFKWLINFATSKKESSGYADKGHTYRVKYNHLKEPSHDPIPGYVRTEHDIPPEHIEYHDGKKWKKLK